MLACAATWGATPVELCVCPHKSTNESVGLCFEAHSRLCAEKRVVGRAIFKSTTRRSSYFHQTQQMTAAFADSETRSGTCA
jgi:hypothetical protein